MSTQQLRRAVVAATSAVLLAGIVSCSNTTSARRRSALISLRPVRRPPARRRPPPPPDPPGRRRVRAVNQFVGAGHGAQSRHDRRIPRARRCRRRRPICRSATATPSATENVVSAIDCAQLHDGQVIFIDVELDRCQSRGDRRGQVVRRRHALLHARSSRPSPARPSDSETSDYDLAIVITSQPGRPHGGLLRGRRQDRGAVGRDRGKCQRLLSRDRGG